MENSVTTVPSCFLFLASTGYIFAPLYGCPNLTDDTLGIPSSASGLHLYHGHAGSVPGSGLADDTEVAEAWVSPAPYPPFRIFPERHQMLAPPFHGKAGSRRFRMVVLGALFMSLSCSRS